MLVVGYVVFLFKQKTAYEWRISDWSADVCSSDLRGGDARRSGPAATTAMPKRSTSAPAAPIGAPMPSGAGPSRRTGTSRCSGTARRAQPSAGGPGSDRKRVVSGKSVSVRVDIGGRRIIKKKQTHERADRNI